MKRLDPDALPLSLSQLQAKVEEPLFPPSVVFLADARLKPLVGVSIRSIAASINNTTQHRLFRSVLGCLLSRKITSGPLSAFCATVSPGSDIECKQANAVSVGFSVIFK